MGFFKSAFVCTFSLVLGGQAFAAPETQAAAPSNGALAAPAETPPARSAPDPARLKVLHATLNAAEMSFAKEAEKARLADFIQTSAMALSVSGAGFATAGEVFPDTKTNATAKVLVAAAGCGFIGVGCLTWLGAWGFESFFLETPEKEAEVKKARQDLDIEIQRY